MAPTQPYAKKTLAFQATTSGYIICKENVCISSNNFWIYTNHWNIMKKQSLAKSTIKQRNNTLFDA